MSWRLGEGKFLESYLGVAQLGARYLGVVEAAGSSPVTQIKKRRFARISFFIYGINTNWLKQ